jgi:hypothetical protein
MTKEENEIYDKQFANDRSFDRAFDRSPKRGYGDLSPEEKRKLDEELAAIPIPKIRIEIETGIFAPFVKLFSRLGLCKMKERVQAENPDKEVFYDYE